VELIAAMDFLIALNVQPIDIHRQIKVICQQLLRYEREGSGA
jgi:hypothetical protein